MNGTYSTHLLLLSCGCPLYPDSALYPPDTPIDFRVRRGGVTSNSVLFEETFTEESMVLLWKPLVLQDRTINYTTAVQLGIEL